AAPVRGSRVSPPRSLASSCATSPRAAAGEAGGGRRAPTLKATALLPKEPQWSRALTRRHSPRTARVRLSARWRHRRQRHPTNNPDEKDPNRRMSCAARGFFLAGEGKGPKPARLRAPGAFFGRSDVEDVDPQVVHRLLSLDVELEELPRPDQHPHRDQDRAADGDHPLVV